MSREGEVVYPYYTHHPMGYRPIKVAVMRWVHEVHQRRCYKRTPCLGDDLPVLPSQLQQSLGDSRG